VLEKPNFVTVSDRKVEMTPSLTDMGTYTVLLKLEDDQSPSKESYEVLVISVLEPEPEEEEEE